MLSSDYLFNMTDDIVKLYEELNTSIVNDMARRISKMNFVSESTKWQMQRSIEAGAIYEDVTKRLAEITGKSENELKKVFKEVGIENLNNNLKKAGRKVEGLVINENMANILVAGLNKTNGVLRNLTMTTALQTKNKFTDVLDLAYNQLITGNMDYNTVIRNTVKKIASDGVSTFDYKNGYSQKIDSAVRTCVLTGVNQTTGNMTELQADEVGADGYETTAHGGARDSHQIWQGKQFYKDKPIKGYEDFKTITGYGTITGLKGVNCRHDFFWVFLGEDEPSYTKKELNALNDKVVNYNGQKMTIYNAQKQMRYFERGTRSWKRQANALESAGLDNSLEKAKVREWSNRYKDFTNTTGLKKQNERLVVYDKNLSSKQNNPKKENLKNNIKEKLESKTLNDCEQILKNKGINFNKEKFVNIDEKLLTENTEQLMYLLEKYPKTQKFINENSFTLNTMNNKNINAYCSSNTKGDIMEIAVNKNSYNNYLDHIKYVESTLEANYHMPFSKRYTSKYVLNHEFGHFFENILLNEYNDDNKDLFDQMREKAMKSETLKSMSSIINKYNKKFMDKVAKEIHEIALVNNPKFLFNENLSRYGKKNSAEFFAECFANLESGKPNELGKAMEEYLKGKM